MEFSAWRIQNPQSQDIEFNIEARKYYHMAMFMESVSLILGNGHKLLWNLKAF